MAFRRRESASSITPRCGIQTLEEELRRGIRFCFRQSGRLTAALVDDLTRAGRFRAGQVDHRSSWLAVLAGMIWPRCPHGDARSLKVDGDRLATHPDGLLLSSTFQRSHGNWASSLATASLRQYCKAVRMPARRLKAFGLCQRSWGLDCDKNHPAASAGNSRTRNRTASGSGSRSTPLFEIAGRSGQGGTRPASPRGRGHSSRAPSSSRKFRRGPPHQLFCHPCTIGIKVREPAGDDDVNSQLFYSNHTISHGARR
jgi:hypothetical protein